MRQRLGSIIIGAGAVFLAGSLTAPPARADAIDGDWCNGTSHFVIKGDTIVTPARSTIQGRYTRYSFAYVVPANEPGAGSEITMVMVRGQELVHLNRGGSNGAPEVWRRCKPVS